MRIVVLPNAMAVARRAAEVIAAEARAAVITRGQFLLAVSGGDTPRPMFRMLADENLPWGAVHIFQVDERAASMGDAGRNLTHLREHFVDRAELPLSNLHAMPMEQPDLSAAAAEYAQDLAAIAGSPAALDVVHLGLGSDGHTASLVLGDPALDVLDREVTTTRVFAGWRRLTLTLPVFDRARLIVWLVTGAEKAAILPRLLAGDRSIPAGRVQGGNALVLADADAAAVWQSGARPRSY